MKTLLISIGLVAMSQALLSWGRSKRFINWRIDREADTAEQDADLSKEVYDAITDTLTKAREGMNATDLLTASETVSSLADAHRKEVPAEEIDNLINKIATGFEGAQTVSALFDDPLNFEKSKLESAFRLWGELVEEGKLLIAEGKPDDGVLGAISKTAKAISTIVKDIGEIVTYVERFPQRDRRGYRNDGGWRG